MRKEICLREGKVKFYWRMKIWENQGHFRSSNFCVSEDKGVSQRTEANRGKDTLRNVRSGPLLQNSNS